MECPLCEGTGKIREGNVTCPDCAGTGELPDDGTEERAVNSGKAVSSLPDSDFVFPDTRTFPIDGPGDVSDAVSSWGRYKGSETFDAFKTNLTALAKSKGPDFVAQLPADWNVESKSARRPRRAKRTDMPRGHEWRTSDVGALSLDDQTASGGDVILNGTAIVYSTPYTVNDLFGSFAETMNPGCVPPTANLDTRYLFNHGGMVLARSTTGSLTLADTPKALTYRAALNPEQPSALDLICAVEAGNVSQCSVGMSVADDTWSPDYEQRSISRLGDLFDVSAVAYPASPTTQVEIAQRMAAAMPIESRERVRRYWSIARSARQEAREGKVFSQANLDGLTQVLDALHAADDVDIPGIVEDLQAIDSAVDKGQAALSSVLGIADPDGDPADLEPALEPPTATEDRASLEMELELLKLRR